MEGIFNRKHTLTDAVEAAVDAVDPEDDDAAVDAAVEAAVDADGSSIWQMIAVSKIAKKSYSFFFTNGQYSRMQMLPMWHQLELCSENGFERVREVKWESAKEMHHGAIKHRASK